MEIHLDYKPVKKNRLYEEVAEQIKISIFEGKLKPGDQLPSERDLAQVFDVGRPTIREALRTLGVLGLIESTPGYKGSVVKKIDVTQYLDVLKEQFSLLIKSDVKTNKELWEVRKYIELGISHAVAKNASDAELAELDDLIQQMENKSDHIETYFKIAAEFHLKLALMSKNKIFYIIWNMFHDLAMQTYLPVIKELFPDGPETLLNANKLVLEAVKTRDIGKIEKAMAVHAKEEDVFLNVH